MADPFPTKGSPAATVVLARDQTSGGIGDGTGGTGIEVLMLKKNSKITFGGMWVFPGGRVDPEDDDPDKPGDELAAARRAAVRESAEEAALIVDPASLVTLSHWTPPAMAPRIFLTWFFLAPAPAGGEVTIDGGEIHEHGWLSPAAALAARDAGEIELAPPTWVTLHHLAAFASVDEAIAASGVAEPIRYRTCIGDLDGDLVTMWAGDAGHDSGRATLPGPRHRLVMGKTAWRFEHSA